MDDEILLIDKPEGVSSFGVVARVRGKLSKEAGTVMVRGKDGVMREKRKKVKVGHTGTLDPFATGLLVLLIGKGTKRANEFLKLDKEYIATVRLGATSTTGDPEGEVTVLVPAEGGVSGDPESVSDGRLTDGEDDGRSVRVPLLADVEKAVEKFVGETEQRVPSYSAVKINGERAYRLARAGKEVEMPVRKVRIDEIEILDYKWPDLTIRCQVSSGTYIRALGEDIGKELGVGGYLTALRRTQVGKHRVEEAMRLEEFLG